MKLMTVVQKSSIASVTLMMLAPLSASAEDDIGQPGPPVDMRIVLADGTLGLAVSPAGCQGQSNDPHISSKAPTIGDIKGYATTFCSYVVDELHVKAGVWRRRWWGYQEMDSTSGTYSNASSIGRSGHYNGCENNNWRTVGNHYSIENGITYSLETMNYKDIDNC